jgi:lysophospholipase L1-like esterase
MYGGQLFLAVVGVFTAIVVIDLSGWLDKRLRAKRVAGFLALLAVSIAMLSGPPLPLPLALLTLAATFTYLFFGFGEREPRRKILGAAAAAACFAAILVELPYYFKRGSVPRPTRVFVIGDSLTSGGFGERQPWPSVLAQQAKLPVTNLALASADAVMALEREVPQLPRPNGERDCVLIEIGGNDMLDGVALGQFEHALDGVMDTSSCQGKRQLVVLELPLLPGRWPYGAIQRRLAKKHACTLVPKRILMRVLLAEGNTSDGVHMTQQGHNEFARDLSEWLVWSVPASGRTTRR